MSRRPSSRRAGWVTLLVATGIIVGGGYAVQRNRQKRDNPPVVTPEPPGPPDADAPGAPRVSRSPSPLAVATVITMALLVVAVLAVVLSHRDRVRTIRPDMAAYPVAPPRIPRWTPEPTPTPTPTPAATVEPGSMASDGVTCDADTAPPVLNTAHPVLTARMTVTGPTAVEIKELDTDGFVSASADDLTSRDGFVTLYFRGNSRLEPGKSYRWRVRGTPVNDWSPWCEFSIAAVTVDTLHLDAERSLTAGLPPSRWRDITGVLGPGWPHGDTPRYWMIQAAGGKVSAGDVPVTLRGWDWETVIESMAEWASARNDPELWRLVDALSVKLGGPPHPTLGYPRA